MADLARLQHIVAVARTASFSRAAQDVRLTQPALSRSVAAFEARHGVRLFERRRGGVVVTPVGRMVVERAQAILSAARELDESLSAHAAGDRGEVSLGVGPLVASMFLPALGRRILATRPRLKLRTTIKARGALIADLGEDKLELVVASPGGPDILMDFDVRMIARLPLGVFARAQHPLAARRDLATVELLDWPAAAHLTDTPGIGGNAGVFACENHHVLKDIVLSSDCYCVTSRALVADELADGRLVALDVTDFPLRDVEVAILRRRNRALSPAALAVEADIAALLADFVKP